MKKEEKKSILVENFLQESFRKSAGSRFEMAFAGELMKKGEFKKYWDFLKKSSEICFQIKKKSVVFYK